MIICFRFSADISLTLSVHIMHTRNFINEIINSHSRSFFVGDLFGANRYDNVLPTKGLTYSSNGLFDTTTHRCMCDVILFSFLSYIIRLSSSISL